MISRTAKMFLRKARVAILLVALLGLPEAHAADTNLVIEGWLAAQSKVQTWSADFTQTRRLKTLTQPLISKGKLWFAAPNRFRWELGDPPQTIAIRHEEGLLILYPRLKRAEQYPLTMGGSGPARDALALVEAGFPRNRAEIDRQFRVLSLVNSNHTWQITLQPALTSTRRIISEISINLSTNDFSLLATEVVFGEGSRVHNVFSDPVINGPVNESLFHPKLDPDVKISRPLAK